MKKQITITLLVILGILIIGNLFGVVNAEISGSDGGMINSSVGVKYDQKVLDNFESSEWVDVLVDLKDTSDLPATNVKERDAWFKPKIDEVFVTLSEEDFNLLWKTSVGFRGEISRKGFNKLINDSRVRAIYFNDVVGLHDNNETIKDNEEIIDKTNDVNLNLNYLWIIALVVLIIMGYILFKIKNHK